MTPTGLFLAFLTCTVVNAVACAIGRMDVNSRWVKGLLYLLVAFVASTAIKITASFSYQGKMYRYTEFIFWLFYFLEHFFESVLWSVLGSLVHLRHAMPLNCYNNVLETLTRLGVLTMIFSVVVIITIFFAYDIARTLTALRLMSLFLTICSAFGEYTNVLVTGLLLRDPLVIMMNRTTMILVLFPCVTLVLTLFVCGIPIIQLSDYDLVFECLHLTTLCFVICGIWYHILLINAECTEACGEACRSRRISPNIHDAVSTRQINLATRPHWLISLMNNKNDDSDANKISTSIL